MVWVDGTAIRLDSVRTEQTEKLETRVKLHTIRSIWICSGRYSVAKSSLWMELFKLPEFLLFESGERSLAGSVQGQVDKELNESNLCWVSHSMRNIGGSIYQRSRVTGDRHERKDVAGSDHTVQRWAVHVV